MTDLDFTFANDLSVINLFGFSLFFISPCGHCDTMSMMRMKLLSSSGDLLFLSVAFGPALTLEHFHILRYYWTNFDYIWSIVTYCLRATTKTSTIQTLRIFLLLDIHETNSVHNHIEQGSFIVKCCYNVCIFGILQGPIWTRAQNTRRAFYSLQQNDGHISITDVHELPTQMS